jgi:NAD(P)-dependent dehydrogenase (short-subunit alcohol dehydrogenase family)
MHDKTVLITGASSGIGKVAARELAAAGAHVIMVARPSPWAESAHREVAAAGRADLEWADLSSQAQIRALAARLSERPISVLINNAGAVFPTRQLSADGIEATFATNHLAYFLLTQLLLPTLKAQVPARIVNVASDAHRRGHIDLGDLQAQKRYRSFRAYSDSKLANVLFTAELARRLVGTGVTANCLHPGVVRSGFARQYGGIKKWVWKLGGLFMISPGEGARTIVYLASSPAVAGVSGQYFQRCHAVEPSRAARDPDLARGLWNASEQLVAPR